MRRIGTIVGGFVLLLAALLGAGRVLAQDVIWIGRPTVADYIGYNIRQLAQQWQEMQQRIAEFNAQVENARRAYFSAGPSNRAATGDAFGKLLFDKDMLIAFPRIGGEEQGKTMATLLAAANNGKLPDGGIPPSARRAFDAWVVAMRRQSGGNLGMLSDPAKFGAVIQNADTMKEYEAYRRLRDQAERDDWEAERSGTGRRLLANHLISPQTYFARGSMGMKGFDARIAELKTPILQCEYAGRQFDGSIFHFWQGQAPDNIGTLLAMNGMVMEELADHAVEACPADSKAAAAIASARLKTVLTKQQIQDARAQRFNAPVDPARVQAIQEANARNRQAMLDRGAAINAFGAERQAGFRACQQTAQPEMLAARQARDRDAQAAAQAKYAACVQALPTRPPR